MGSVILLVMIYAVFLFYPIIAYVLESIGYWHIFVKAGESGWEAVIPFYRKYIRYKLSWDSGMFWVSLLCTFAGMLLFMIIGHNIAYCIGILFFLAALVINFIDLYKLSAAFGHEIGYMFGLWFLGPVFYMILGLGNSEYKYGWDDQTGYIGDNTTQENPFIFCPVCGACNDRNSSYCAQCGGHL